VCPLAAFSHDLVGLFIEFGLLNCVLHHGVLVALQLKDALVADFVILGVEPGLESGDNIA